MPNPHTIPQPSPPVRRPTAVRGLPVLAVTAAALVLLGFDPAALAVAAACMAAGRVAYGAALRSPRARSRVRDSGAALAAVGLLLMTDPGLSRWGRPAVATGVLCLLAYWATAPAGGPARDLP